MEWIALIVAASALLAWFLRDRPAGPGPDAGARAVVDALGRNGHTDAADRLEVAWARSARARRAAIDYVVAQAPRSTHDGLVRARDADASTRETLMAVGPVESKLLDEHYLHVRHDLRNVLMLRDQAVEAGAGLARRGTPSPDDLDGALAALRRACEGVERVVGRSARAGSGETAA